MLRISLLSGYRPIKIGSVNFACKQSNWHLSILVLLNAGLHNNTISSCCALSKSLHPFAIRAIALLAHVVQARKCFAFPCCRAIALSKSDLSISPASSRIDISRFWYCSMLVYIITRFLRAAHSRNRYRHSQSGLSPFLLMSVCSSHSDHALPASSHAWSLWMSLLYLIIPFSCVFGYSFV